MTRKLQLVRLVLGGFVLISTSAWPVGAQEAAPAAAAAAAAPAAAPAPSVDPAPPEPAAPAFSVEQISQMVAPIALYPDGLLMQILISSTYPLEVVAADRWAKKNSTLTGEAIDKALEAETWDPSVEAMVHFPDVLGRMSENLDWTQDLGDAFLAQQVDVLDTIQRLRKEAYAAGNLKSGEQQTVVVEKETQVIQIQPAQPEVVYVPQYNSAAVYGAPPPATNYYPTVNSYSGTDMAVASVVSFGVGMALGALIFDDDDCDWDNHYVYGGYGGHNDVDIDINGDVNIGNRVNVGNGNRQPWQHNPAHRGGVRYRDDKTRKAYSGGATARPGLSRDAALGYNKGTLGSNGGLGSGGGRGNDGSRVAAAQRPGIPASSNKGGVGKGAVGNAKAPGGIKAPSAGSRVGAGTGTKAAAPKVAAQARPSPGIGASNGKGSGALGGLGSGSATRAASARGSASRGKSGGLGGGGGSRGGGGGGRRR